MAHPVASTSRLSSLPLSAPHSPPPPSSPADLPLCPTYSSSLASLSPDPTPPDARAYPVPHFPMDYYERPPSPPRTLKDRMQVAYALDDMHLAKVLLLKLQGIDVTGDDDPRIAAVRDEDFTSAFVPPGGLRLEEDDARRCREGAARERARIARIERDERLRACARVWERHARASRDAKARAAQKREDAARRKEDEARQRRRAEREAREREARAREQELLRHTRQVRFSSLNQRPLLDYSTLSSERMARRPPREDEDDDILYTALPLSPRHSPSSSAHSLSPPGTPDRDALTLQRFQHELAVQHSQSLSRAVAFDEVVAAMDGPLFPVNGRPDQAARAKLSPAQRAIYDSMFDVVEWTAEERMTAMGKLPEDAPAKLRNSAPRDARTECVACSLGSTSTSVSASASAAPSAEPSSATTVTRTNSWFSFGSRSSRSTASTALTSPASSILSLKSPAQAQALLPLAPSSSSSVLHAEPRPIRHSCRRSALAPVPPSEDPLAPPHPYLARARHTKDHPPSAALLARGRTLARSDSRHRASQDERGLVRRVGRSVTTLMDIAAQFQRAYVKATLFSVGADRLSLSRSRSGSRSPPRARRTPSPTRGRAGRPRPEGYRALAPDVHAFLDAPDEPPCATPQRTRTLIPLAQRGGPPCDAPRVFGPPALPPPRSPFRALLPPLPGCAGLPRLRPVANPVLLRLQALQNICAGRALVWEGRACEGRMSAGREKLVGVAWEGIGRSSLGWEVRPVSTC